MRIKHRFAFGKNDTDIFALLSDHCIEYDRGDIISVVEITEDDKNYKTVAEIFQKHKIQPISETIYSKQEIKEAEWLTIRSTWRNDYPQPEKDFGYMLSTYDSSDYCDQCGKGLVQKGCFSIKKKPKWGSRQFLMINWIHDELFISGKAESVLKSNSVKGIDFYEVNNSSNKPIEGIKQIYVKTCLPPGMKKASVKNELVCRKCGVVKYMRKQGFIYYDKEVFNGISDDIVKSHEKFGEITCASKIFITKKLHEVIINNHIDRGLVFEPIKLA